MSICRGGDHNNFGALVFLPLELGLGSLVNIQYLVTVKSKGYWCVHRGFPFKGN